MSREINLVFPHQLFRASPLIDNGMPIYLIEEFLFFRQYDFHKQKLAFHRATMKSYQQYLKSMGKDVRYIECTDPQADIRTFDQEIKAQGVQHVHVIDPDDNWLEKRLKATTLHCDLTMYPNPSFLNKKEDLQPFFRSDKKSFFQTSFYKSQRKKRNILINENQEPDGGKWTYDVENRKKYPKNKVPPNVYLPEKSLIWDEAVAYVENNFANNPGLLTHRIYPIDTDEAHAWFDQFLSYRFYDFGRYEDAIVREHSYLHHSILSPLLNIGILLPQFIIDKALAFASAEDIPINSTEGFIRQIIGWREFIRGMYECKGSYSRTQNFWNMKRKIPPSFYDGTTGIEPIDKTIHKVLETGYCHHIERLMILGNFMLLCEFDPDEVYRWFMELFIDAYDWVMVPNVYGMSQFADGGTFATKPYIGGSNYIKKMSNYPHGDWDEVWDGLFWNFVDKHQDFFKSNPRMSMMYHSLQRMSTDKREKHLLNAAAYLKNL